MTAKSRLLKIGIIAFSVLVAAAIVVAIVGFPITPYVEQKLTRIAKDRFESDLEFSNISISLLPPSARVDDLVFRHKGRRDVPPLIQARRATAYLGIRSILSTVFSTPTVRLVRLEGLLIHVARRKAPGEPDESDEPEKDGAPSNPVFIVNELLADGTVLRVLPKDEWKQPLEFVLKTLHMQSVGLNEAMHFVSELSNAKPPGVIQTEGDFGPWAKGDPGMTPVKGEYTFENADLGDFNGIGGILSSKGRFNGALARLEVDGYTDTPDFHVDVSGLPVHLRTDFHAIVDGTNGDTLLQPVTATFGKSKVMVNGGVYEIKGTKGKTVKLDVKVDEGRIEDMMRFAVKSQPPILTGPIRYEAKMAIPPGKRRVVEKLILEGDFKVSDGRFTGKEMRKKLGSLSNKAQGEPEAPAPSDTASDFSGHFILNDALLKLAGLSFYVPGADVNLDGSYHLLTEELDFKGTLDLEVKVSETTTGVKSWFLKLVDPLFNRKEGGGSRIPITIKGKRSDPKFGFDAGGVLKQ